MTNERNSWRRTDRDVILANCPDHLEIGLLYHRLYTPHEKYSYSRTNQLIQNFKKPVNRPRAEINYKEEAIVLFTSELSKLFLHRNNKEKLINLVPAPVSKTVEHPEYDNRLVQVSEKVTELCENITYVPLIERVRDSGPLHNMTTKRDPQVIKADLRLRAGMIESLDPAHLILILDDVLTSGATFTACRQLILEARPGAIVKGAFWARSESPLERAGKLLTEIDIDKLKVNGKKITEGE